MSAIVSDSVRNRFRTGQCTSVFVADNICVRVRVHDGLYLCWCPCAFPCSYHTVCMLAFVTGRGLCLTVFVLVTVFFSFSCLTTRTQTRTHPKNVPQMLGRRHGLRPHEHVSLPLSCALWASAHRTLPWGSPAGVTALLS